jgi:hypothetical protein
MVTYLPTAMYCTEEEEEEEAKEEKGLSMTSVFVTLAFAFSIKR